MSQLNIDDKLMFDTDYSTTEKKTGARWIDGKPIYRIQFSYDVNTYSTISNMRRMFEKSHTITNLGTVTNVFCSWELVDGSEAGKKMVLGTSYAYPGTVSGVMTMIPQVGTPCVVYSGFVYFAIWFITSFSGLPTKTRLSGIIEYTKTTD